MQPSRVHSEKYNYKYLNQWQNVRKGHYMQHTLHT